ncbi:MAG: relaxase/mobilization nuclease domain-containing protein [Prevotella sp.]|nr:relaxase/mobilization nuclease domain-containing protein [Prevotella sp.]
MVIKMETIGGAHAANAISYVLDKEKARKENKPVFLAANNIELNPLTGKPYSPVEVLMDMQLKLATSMHKVENPFWRIELCPPREECSDWTMEQWDRFCRDCVKVLDSTDYKQEVVRDKDGYPVIDKWTGKPKTKVSGKRTMLAKSQYIATVHFDTGKPHVHIVANRLTMDGQMQDTHKCKERAKMAADIIAERYGWVKAEERTNHRMERIHDAAMKVLKSMNQWDIETYFAEMRRNGFEVEPTYDSQGVCRGYSIGEKLYDLDGNYSSTVMYKASAKKFGHGRDLTVSKLYGTWQKLHPEMETLRTESYGWQQSSQPSTAMSPRAAVSSQTDDDEEYLRLLKVKEEALRMSGSNQQETSFVTSAPHKQTEAEQERNSAVFYAVKSIRELVNTPFRTEFYPYDLENLLPEGLVAKAIDMGREPGSSFSQGNLKKAADVLMEMVECSAERATVAMEGLLGVIQEIALPETQPSLGGGSSNNDLPKKKDDEWMWWKNNGFVRNQRSRSRKR